ncbi:MAG: hypothetical protein VB135_03275 [Burkholderia sp.]
MNATVTGGVAVEAVPGQLSSSHSRGGMGLAVPVGYVAPNRIVMKGQS